MNDPNLKVILFDRNVLGIKNSIMVSFLRANEIMIWYVKERKRVLQYFLKSFSFSNVYQNSTMKIKLYKTHT